MIVRTREQVAGTAGDVVGPNWRSLRFLLKDDGMGFTLTESTIEAGFEATLEYQNHFEGCFCVEGEMEVEDLATGEVHDIRPGTVYALDKHDRHRVRVTKDIRFICGFTPALSGPERHDGGGSYPAS